MGAGYLLGKKNARKPKHNIQSQPLQKLGSNVYHSREFYKNKKEETQKVVTNWEASKFPLSTNIIPMYYNTLDIKQDAEKIPNGKYQDKLIYTVLDGLDDAARKAIRSKIDDPQHIFKHIPDNARAGQTDWGLVSGRPSSDRLDTKNGALEQVGGSLLPNRGFEDFTHNNMVPFYSGTVTQNMDADNRMGAGKLELYTGQFKLNHEQKEEQAPLFAPTAGLTNINGSKEQRDMSRYQPNNTGRKNNETPFEKVHVGPGLNQGYTAKPSGGFHQTLRIKPKPIEELRVDPVVEQEGRVKPGKARIDKRTLIAQQYKNRPELLVENKNGERNFTTTGAVTGRKLRPAVLLRDTNRKKSRQLITHAKTVGANAPTAISKSKYSTKATFHNTPFRNAASARTKRHNDYGKSGYKNRLNSRAVTETRNHILNMTPAHYKHKAGFVDKAKKTRKQHYIHNSQPAGYAKPQTAGALPAYDPNQQTRTTIRETTENNGRNTGNVAQIGAGGLVAYDPNQQTRTTIRETTESSGRNNGNVAQIGAGGLVAYDPNQQTRTTIRETTENKKHIGWTGKLGAGAIKSQVVDAVSPTIRETTENNQHIGFSNPKARHALQAYDPLQQTRTTIRETTENNKHLGGVSGAPQKKHIAYDPNDVAKTTIRETTENKKRLGGVSTIRKKHIAYDPKERARTTIRETTEDNKTIGNVQRTSLQRGMGYTSTKVEANNTNRQFTSDNDYTGVANSNSKKTRSYEDAYNAEQNISKEVVAEGRRPMGDNVKLGSQQINFDTRKLDTDRQNHYGHVKNTNLMNIYNPRALTACTNTSDKNNLPSHDFRLDTSTLEAFKKNPLTQSLSSYH